MPETPEQRRRRDELNQYEGRPADGEPANESEHFFICKACGRAVDMRKLGDVFHHEDAGHEPIPTS